MNGIFIHELNATLIALNQRERERESNGPLSVWPKSLAASMIKSFHRKQNSGGDANDSWSISRELLEWVDKFWLGHLLQMELYIQEKI